MSDTQEEYLRLATEAVQLHERLMRVGLIKTGQKMHEVVQQIGYEIAEKESM